MLKRVGIHIRLLSLSLIDFIKGSVPYVGYPSNKNLGDVELFNLSKKYLPFDRFSFNVTKRGRYTRLAIYRSKYFLIGGGTLMFSSQILKECEILLKYGLKPIFLGTGAGEIVLDDDSIKESWKKVFLKSPLTGVRGKNTVATLKELGVAANLCGDLGYILNLNFSEPEEVDDYVVITPRSISPTVYEYYYEDFETRNKLKQLAESLITKGIRVIVYAVSIDDYNVVRGWVKTIEGPIEYLEYGGDFKRYVSILSKARLLVSMRMHPGIFALAMGVLPIELDKRVKFKDSFTLIENSNGESYSLLDPNSISAEELCAKVFRKYNSETADLRLARFNKVKKWALNQRNYCESMPH